MNRSTIALGVLGSALFGLVAACAASGQESSGEDSGVASNDAAPLTPDSGAQPKKDAQSTVDAYVSPQDDGGTVDAQPADVVDASGPKAIVVGHTPDTLYEFDVSTHNVSLVGPFQGCTQTTLTQVIDLAIDAQMNAFATTFDGFYSVDLQTAQCTLIKAGSYPNSLSFVPAGTLDPSVEALVGYNGSTYVRIDTTSGNVTTVGGLTGGYSSSGDIVSVKNGGTFLTVTGGNENCGDCLLQVDPKTGNMIQNYGSINHGSVFGLAFWAGTAYGFDDSGELFSISWINNKLVTTNIPTTGGLQFWGAGSTTSAPPTDTDGGGIPIN